MKKQVNWFLHNTLYSILQVWGKKTEITLAEFWNVCKYYFIYMFVIKLCEINFVYKAMYMIKILVLFRTTKCLKERYKHQQSNVIRKVNKVMERGQKIEHIKVGCMKICTPLGCKMGCKSGLHLFLHNTLYSIIQDWGQQLVHTWK